MTFTATTAFRVELRFRISHGRGGSVQLRPTCTRTGTAGSTAGSTRGVYLHTVAASLSSPVVSGMDQMEIGHVSVHTSSFNVHRAPTILPFSRFLSPFTLSLSLSASEDEYLMNRAKTAQQKFRK